MNKFVALLRVKNGIFFVHDWLSCFEKLVDEIVVVDNGSTDGTYEVLKDHPKVAKIVVTQGYHEGRDKNLMYALARDRNPDWCIWVDVDEIFEPGVTRRDFDRLMNRPFVGKYSFRRFHFIDRTHYAGSWYRIKYSSGHDRVMWKEAPGGYFQDLIIDSPNVKGIPGVTMPTRFRLKHLGYINREIVDQKANLYRTIVPAKEATFQKMYLENERSFKWYDNRNHPKVVMMNILMDLIKFYHLFPRAWHKLISLTRRSPMSGIDNARPVHASNGMSND